MFFAAVICIFVVSGATAFNIKSVWCSHPWAGLQMEARWVRRAVWQVRRQLAYAPCMCSGKYAKPEVDHPPARLPPPPLLCHLTQFCLCSIFFCLLRVSRFVSVQKWFYWCDVFLICDYFWRLASAWCLQQRIDQMVLLPGDVIHCSYGNAGDKEWDWELVGLCIPTEDCLCPPVDSPTICGLNKHS